MSRFFNTRLLAILWINKTLEFTITQNAVQVNLLAVLGGGFMRWDSMFNSGCQWQTGGKLTCATVHAALEFMSCEG